MAFNVTKYVALDEMGRRELIHDITQEFHKDDLLFDMIVDFLKVAGTKSKESDSGSPPEKIKE